MVLNGRKLLKAKPVRSMLGMKLREHGVSYGLTEAGYDVRLRQDVWLFPFRRFALTSTIETFDIPETLVAVLHDKSTNIRRRLMVGNTVLEPGWKGGLTLELFYFGWKPLKLKAGTGIGQVIFHELAEPARYSGKYQGQSSEPVPAILA